MGKLRKELEDLAFPYVYPDEAKRVQESLSSRFGNAKEMLERERKVLQKKLADAGLYEFQTSYRVKGLYSRYNKLKRKVTQNTLRGPRRPELRHVQGPHWAALGARLAKGAAQAPHPSRRSAQGRVDPDLAPRGARPPRIAARSLGCG